MLDACDIAYGLSSDNNSNNVPDECEYVAIPTLSEYGLITLTLLLLGIGGAVIAKRRVGTT